MRGSFRQHFCSKEKTKFLTIKDIKKDIGTNEFELLKQTTKHSAENGELYSLFLSLILRLTSLNELNLSVRERELFLPINNKERMTAGKMFRILLYQYMKQYGRDGFRELCKRWKLPGEIEREDGWYYEITEDDIRKMISETYKKTGYVLDTHTAVAYKVFQDYVAETGDKTPTLIASTASAYKFADSVAKSIGLGEEKNGFEYVKSLAAKTGVRIPAGLKDLENKPVRHTGVIEVPEMVKAVEESVK